MNRKWSQSIFASIVFILYWSLGGGVPGIHANQRQEIARLAELMQWKDGTVVADVGCAVGPCLCD